MTAMDKSKSLIKSTFIVSFMTFLSRILGFVRDMVAAHFFGAGPAYDAFIVASKIPNFMRRLFAEGAFSQAFVPILSEYRANQPHAAVQQLVNRVSGCLSVVLLLVTACGIVGSSMIIGLFAPGFTDHGDPRFLLASDMLKITFPYLLLISLTAFAGGILNCYGRFAVPAFTPVFLNLSLIIAAMGFSQYCDQPVMVLAWGTLVGGIVQIAFQLPFLKQLNLWPRPQINWKDPGVRRVLLLMTPALLGVSVNQLNIMLSSIFGSWLPVGSVSWLYYSERLMEFPLGGIGVALATVVLPRLSRDHAMTDKVSFSKTLDWGTRGVMVMGLPAALGLSILAGPLLATLFQSGRFTAWDVQQSQASLTAYSLGIIGFMLVKIFASAYYARHDVKTPVKFAILTVVANIVGSLILKEYYGHAGLALATSLAALLNATLLGYSLIRRQYYQPQCGWKKFLMQLGFGLTALGLVSYAMSPNLSIWLAWQHWERVWQLSIIVIASIGVYCLSLGLSGLRWRHFQSF